MNKQKSAKSNTEIRTTKNNELAMRRLQEYSNISAIITDRFLESIYENCTEGYYEALDVVFEATDNFYRKFKKDLENSMTHWECIFNSYKEKDITGYADLVAYETYKYLVSRREFDIKTKKYRVKEGYVNISFNVLQQTFNFFRRYVYR